MHIPDNEAIHLLDRLDKRCHFLAADIRRMESATDAAKNTLRDMDEISSALANYLGRDDDA